MAVKEEITHLLQCWKNGDDAALESVFPHVYEALRQQAGRYMSGERKNHTLSSTALVHEAYLRLYEEQDRDWQNRTHFFAVAARIMKNYLVEYAVKRKRQKRGGEDWVFNMEHPEELADLQAGNLILLNEALDELEKIDKRKAWIFEIRYFAGLQLEEIAQTLDISLATVKRDLQFSRAWLRTYYQGGAGD